MAQVAQMHWEKLGNTMRAYQQLTLVFPYKLFSFVRLLLLSRLLLTEATTSSDDCWEHAVPC